MRDLIGGSGESRGRGGREHALSRPRRSFSLELGFLDAV